MKYKRFNTLFYSVTAVFLTCCSAGELGGPDYAEIPFTIENKRIVVEAVANGKKGRFVFDTGTTESYLDIFVMNLVTERYTIIPYKGEQVKTRIYNLNEITFGDIKLRTKSWVIKHSDLLLKVQRDGFDGLLGALTFEGYWCELSFSKSKIILHKEKPGYFTHFSPVMILNYFNADFFIPVIIDGETFYFDIDTGSPYGIYFPGGLVKAKD
ncbi:MAG: hypothetical protein LBF74_11530, partial [Treponema sp.]|nr:hypothetical protein [Treponema sp.]